MLLAFHLTKLKKKGNDVCFTFPSVTVSFLPFLQAKLVKQSPWNSSFFFTHAILHTLQSAFTLTELVFKVAPFVLINIMVIFKQFNLLYQKHLSHMTFFSILTCNSLDIIPTFLISQIIFSWYPFRSPAPKCCTFTRQISALLFSTKPHTSDNLKQCHVSGNVFILLMSIAHASSLSFSAVYLAAYHAHLCVWHYIKTNKSIIEFLISSSQKTKQNETKVILSIFPCQSLFFLP